MLGKRFLDALREITSITGMTSKVSVGDGFDALTLLRVNSSEQMALAVQTNARFHFAYGSSGAIFLSVMEDDAIANVLLNAPKECWNHQKPEDVWTRIHEAKKCGYVADLGSFRPDVFGISAPLFSADGNLQGTVTVTGLLHGRTQEQLNSWCKLLTKKCGELSRQMMPTQSTSAPKGRKRPLASANP